MFQFYIRQSLFMYYKTLTYVRRPLLSSCVSSEYIKMRKLNGEEYLPEQMLCGVVQQTLSVLYYVGYSVVCIIIIKQEINT